MKSNHTQLLVDLCDYQKRETRQQWSEYFELRRTPASELHLVNGIIPHLTFVEAAKNNGEYIFSYSDCEVKFKVGAQAELFPSDKPMSDDRYKIKTRVVALNSTIEQIVLALNNKPQSDTFTLIPGTPFNTLPISQSLSLACNNLPAYPACEALIKRLPSRRTQFASTTTSYDESLNNIIDQALSLDKSYMCIQGPPGTGKTYTGARIIHTLLQRHKRVGVMAMSHKAINNLLEEVDSLLTEYPITNKKLIKSPSIDNPTNFDHISFARINQHNCQADLLAATIFSFANLPDQYLDTLVIDEAGQIPLAWALAAGRVAKNIILLGDQQQLPQVSQSLHPQGSGVSVLEHLMQTNAVIPKEFGYLLDTSRRMHPDICHFISQLMYNGQLKAHPLTREHSFAIPQAKHPALLGDAIHCRFLNHSNRAQESPEEAHEIHAIIKELLSLGFTADNILIICPYRAQEGLIRSLLPESFSTKIGTVDRFQGREADIVIFSMTSSDAENLPRDMEFLYSTHRLNVAISRARKKIIVLASEKLLTIPAKTIPQARLISSLCHLKEYSQSLAQKLNLNT